LSTAPLSLRTGHTEILLANDNAKDNGGTQVNRQTIPETPGKFAGSPLSPLDSVVLSLSYQATLHVVGTCVKWIPPLFALYFDLEQSLENAKEEVNLPVCPGSGPFGIKS